MIIAFCLTLLILIVLVMKRVYGIVPQVHKDKNPALFTLMYQLPVMVAIFIMKLILLEYTGFAVEYSDCANGQIRLSNGTSKMQGRVELCYNHVWFGICADDYRHYYDIGTVCNSMGHSQSKHKIITLF